MDVSICALLLRKSRDKLKIDTGNSKCALLLSQSEFKSNRHLKHVIATSVWNLNPLILQHMHAFTIFDANLFKIYLKRDYDVIAVHNHSSVRHHMSVWNTSMST